MGNAIDIANRNGPPLSCHRAIDNKTLTKIPKGGNNPLTNMIHTMITKYITEYTKIYYYRYKLSNLHGP